MSHRFRPPTIRETEAPSTREPNAAPILSPGILAGAVTSGQLAIDQASDFAVASVATTDTVNWTTAAWNAVYVPSPATMCLFVWAETTWTHSVSNGLGDFRIKVGDDFGNNYTLQARWNIAGTFTAGLRGFAALSGGVNLGVSFPALRAGFIRCDLQISPTTAGTMTAIVDTTDVPQIHMFTTGDTSPT